MHLDLQHIDELQQYLLAKAWLQPGETVVSATKPGEGNMNYVLRIDTGERTFIIKQSRPYVEKYPTIAAPANRAVIEGMFYQLVQLYPSLLAFTPALLGIDEEENIIAVEDLGASSDYTFLYQRQQQINDEDVRMLVEFISTLHNSIKPTGQFENREMRQLNHEHIFIYPLMEDNGFNLDNIQAGLQLAAMKYKTDDALRNKAKLLGDVYLSQGNHLLHGDYYPGSWLQTNDGVKIIDPEFCFFGPAEFDLGVMIAHLKMTGQPSTVIESVLQHYQFPDGFNKDLLNQFIGIEIIRRIIGLAQLPLVADLSTKQQLLEEGYSLIINN